ncbi:MULTISPECIES: hypothetical protein [Streptomyces]|jgi:hypothetical protein|uniref:hypothetical protein n=1 Tax=Streptomyces TaxID=1883 RepID=UPI000BD9F7B3|nr:MULTISPECIES: hypothetical protein [Streptomyces]MCX4437502.1 hypothetical protein [Streptomyces mirabilis]SOE60704.1 hypothetical protein SAMN05446589_1777 [Streptomyces sp. OV198]
MNTSKEAARGLTDIETFLYRHAHLEAARQRVAGFTTRVPGLTQEQKVDIASWYLKEQTYVARMVTEHLAASISEVQQQHHVRFTRWLRGTLTAMILITVAMALCFAVLLGSLG